MSRDEINDNIEDFFRVFDNSLPNPPRMNAQIWFTHEFRTPCSPCEGHYLPHLDRQCYCIQCNKWIHIRCLGVDEPTYPDFDPTPNQGFLDTETTRDGLPLIFDDVLSRPTVRGHGGDFKFEDCWLNTGSGVQKGLIERWKADGKVPDDWLKQFGERFLEEFVLEKNWKWYTCCICSGRM